MVAVVYFFASVYFEYFEELLFIIIFLNLQHAVYHALVKNKIFRVKIYISRGKQSQWDFDFSALFRIVRTVPLHEFIHSKYKTIHELDPTVWCVSLVESLRRNGAWVMRLAMPLWRTWSTIYYYNDIEHNAKKFRYAAENGISWCSITIFQSCFLVGCNLI